MPGESAVDQKPVVNPLKVFPGICLFMLDLHSQYFLTILCNDDVLPFQVQETDLLELSSSLGNYPRQRKAGWRKRKWQQRSGDGADIWQGVVYTLALPQQPRKTDYLRTKYTCPYWRKESTREKICPSTGLCTPARSW